MNYTGLPALQLTVNPFRRFMKLALICIAPLAVAAPLFLDGGWALLAGPKRIPSEASRIHALKLGLD